MSIDHYRRSINKTEDYGLKPEMLLNGLEERNIWKDIKAAENDQLYNANDFLYYVQGQIGSKILIEQILENIIS